MSENELQVKIRLRTAGNFLKSPAVRGFFAGAGKKRPAPVCVFKKEKNSFVLGKWRFYTGAGTDSVPKFAKGEPYERRI